MIMPHLPDVEVEEVAEDEVEGVAEEELLAAEVVGEWRNLYLQHWV
jgi:hypothetical protein